MVINREDIFNQAEAGYFHPLVDSVTGLPTPAGDAFIAPEYKGKNQAVDVEGAKKVLTDAGFKLDGTTLNDPSGKPVKLTLTDPAGWSDYQTSLEIMKDNLAQIGIAATVDKANQDAWFKNVEEGNFDATFRWTNGGATPYDIYQTIMDGALLKPIGTGGAGRQLRPLQQPRGDRGAEGATPTPTDDAARTAAMNTLQKIFVEQMPMIPVGARQRRCAVQHEELGRLARRLQPVRRRAAHPGQRAGRRPAPQARHLLIRDTARPGGHPSHGAGTARQFRHPRRQEPGMTFSQPRRRGAGHRGGARGRRPDQALPRPPDAARPVRTDAPTRARGRRREPHAAPRPGDRPGRRVRLRQVHGRPAARPALPAHRRRHPAARRVDRRSSGGRHFRAVRRPGPDDLPGPVRVAEPGAHGPVPPDPGAADPPQRRQDRRGSRAGAARPAQPGPASRRPSATWTSSRTSSPAASGSASRSPARWAPTRRRCSPTSRCPCWTSPSGSAC